jgi:hypothetical protein
MFGSIHPLRWTRFSVSSWSKLAGLPFYQFKLPQFSEYVDFNTAAPRASLGHVLPNPMQADRGPNRGQA